MWKRRRPSKPSFRSPICERQAFETAQPAEIRALILFVLFQHEMKRSVKINWR